MLLSCLVLVLKIYGTKMRKSIDDFLQEDKEILELLDWIRARVPSPEQYPKTVEFYVKLYKYRKKIK